MLVSICSLALLASQSQFDPALDEALSLSPVDNKSPRRPASLSSLVAVSFLTIKSIHCQQDPLLILERQDLALLLRRKYFG